MSDAATTNLTDKATYERLQKDVIAVKNDIAALTEPVSYTHLTLPTNREV